MLAMSLFFAVKQSRLNPSLAQSNTLKGLCGQIALAALIKG